MPDWSRKFKAEYDYARGWLGKDAEFAEDWRPLVRRLDKLCDPAGFDPGEAGALTRLREQVGQGDKRAFGHRKATEDQGILRAVGGWSDDGSGGLEARARMRAAALKLLRHVYLVSRAGSRRTWCVSLPAELQDWPSDDFNARAGTQDALRALLRSNAEVFSADDRKHLAHATRDALHWCQRAGMVLALAAAAADGKARARRNAALDVVRRWFAEPAVPASELALHIDRLQRGFKDIVAMLGQGRFILTDWVPLRTASTAAEIDFLNAEAFTFASRGEGLDVVYIERSFFASHPGNVLARGKNWARIIVHELTHLVCGTEDVNIGKPRYAWYGIGPHAGYPGSACIRNADNWAFFSADCAGQLTDAERDAALKIA